MKTKLHFSIFMMFIVFFTYAQETTVDLSMGSSYVNQVYYKLNSETETSYEASSWDIAFLRISNFNQAIVVNDAIGIEVFQAASVASEWDNIDIASDSNTWTQLHNSDTDRANGAFMKGSATYGWGEYNVFTHIVEGTTIYVLKYVDGSYKKFMCENYTSGVYNIKYASWDVNSSTWSEDKTASISNADNQNNRYNYYSLQNEVSEVAEPASTDWDLVFRKYTTDVGGGTMYSVTGVLTADDVEVAQVLSGSNTSNLTYSSDINIIGYDWKALNFQTFTFDVDSDTHFYIKDSDENIFKLYYTEFGGQSTGNVQFKFENVTQTLDVENVGENVSFGVYPNPVGYDKQVNVVFDVNSINEDSYTVEVYSLAGQKVYATSVTSTQGFYNKQLDLSSLNSGVYLLKFVAGSYSKTKKIVIQ